MRDENADRACGGIIPPPSRSSFYIVRSRSPLTVNNRRFRAVTSGTRDSRSIPRALTPAMGCNGMQRALDPQQACATVIDVAEEPRDRGKLSEDNARQSASCRNIRFRTGQRRVRILRGSIHSRACLCMRVAMRWMNCERANRTMQEFFRCYLGLCPLDA